MRKIISLFIVFIFSFFFLYYFVEAKECKYDSIGLTVTDGNVSEDDWTNFANPILQDVLHVKIDNRDDYSSNVSDIFFQDKCAKHVYACTFVEAELSLSDFASINFNNLSIGDVNKIFPTITFSQKNLLYDESAFQNSDYYGYYTSSGGFKVSTSSLDFMNSASSFCSQGSGDWLAQLAGGACWLAAGAARAGYRTVGGIVTEVVDPEKYYIGRIECREDDSNDPDAIDANCPQLYSIIHNYNQVISDYKTCGDNHTCKVNKINILNEYDSMIKGTCSSILKTFSYDDTQKYCLEECFGIANKLNEMKRGTDLYEDFSTSSGTCSVSQKIWNFISNIFKWAKYFAPVLVIVLGIIDFIKAIASQSDDEMKKVQVRFIKRLIAAALLYIVPFLIEFALDAFNLVSDNPYCGLK